MRPSSHHQPTDPTRGNDDPTAHTSSLINALSQPGVRTFVRSPGFRLTIGRRVTLLIVIGVISCIVLFAIQLGSLRETLMNERRMALANQVQATASAVNALAAEAAVGHLTDTEAQKRAKSAVRAIRYGNNDYLFYLRL